MIIRENPVFIVGAPKCGSTSMHLALGATGIFDYPKIKDTHYLLAPDFKMEKYSKFFQCNGKRVFEIDQNLAISPEAFSNISSHFTEFTIVYIVRDQKDRFFSAYKWLLKMGQKISSIEEAVDREYNWMISHGLYRRNIEKNILPNLPPKSKLLIVKFEDLIAADGITYRLLMSFLGVLTDDTAILPRHNQSLTARSPLFVRSLKAFLETFRPLVPKFFVGFVKRSKKKKKILFEKSDALDIDKSGFIRYADIFNESDEFINSLIFQCGIMKIGADEEL